MLLFGQDAEDPEHDARHNLIEAMLWKIASRLITIVILDSGFGHGRTVNMTIATRQLVPVVILGLIVSEATLE